MFQSQDGHSMAPQPPQRWVKRLLAANADAPRKARRIVAEATTGLPRELRDRATLVASELVSNAVKYGSRPGDSISIDVETDPGSATITIVDEGNPVDTDATGEHLGLVVLRQLADRWTIDAGPSWTVSAVFEA